MKKLIAIVLTMILCLSLFVGCDSEELAGNDKAKEISSGDFTVEKIEVVAYAGGSLATREYDYLVTIKNESTSIIMCAKAEHYMTWNVGDVISGKFYEIDTVTSYDTLKFEFTDGEVVACVAYMNHN